MNTNDSRLLLTLQILQIQKLIPVLKFCSLMVTAEESILHIICHNPNVVSILRLQQETIATYVYVKLGCNQIYFWLHNNLFRTYNIIVSAAIVDKINNAMTLTLDRPETATNTNWFSFKSIADSLSERMNLPITEQEVKGKVEQFGLLCSFNNGEVGLPKSSLSQFVNNFIDDYKRVILSDLAPTPLKKSAGRKSKLVAAVVTNADESEEGKQQVSINQEEGILTLPDDYEEQMMTGRSRKPDIPNGLKIAINRLGESGVNPKDALVKIVSNEPAAQGFVDKLSEIFKSTNKSPAKAKGEILSAALALLQTLSAA